MDDLERLLITEQRQVDDLIRLYQGPDLNPHLMINHGWDAHDVLAHLVSWHESFALNMALRACGEPPQPPRGTSYTRAQHLDVDRGHIHGHFWELVDSYVKASQHAGPVG